MLKIYRIMLVAFSLVSLENCKTAKPVHKKQPQGTNFVELAGLAFPAMGGQQMEYSDILWSELYQLPRWYFLMSPASRQTQLPAMQSIGGKSWYLAFTDLGKLKYYAKTSKNVDAKGNALYLTMTPGQAVEFARTNSSAPVSGVLFNQGQKATWFSPLRELTLLPEYLKSKGML